MTTSTPIAAAILAGGDARRLGGVRKATLEIGGIPIIGRQLAGLRPVTTWIFIVANDKSPHRQFGIPIVAEAPPGCGARGSIYTAVVASPAGRTVVVGCDMPFVGVPLLQQLATLPDADLVVPRSTRRYEPLCAIYSRASAEPSRSRLDRGELEAAVLPDGARIEEIGPELLAANDPHGLLFVTINTPHDYERARGPAQRTSKGFVDRIMDGSASG